jgi:hypothetical protein
MAHQLPMGVVKLNIYVSQYGQANQVGHFDGSCFLIVMVDYRCMYSATNHYIKNPFSTHLQL